MHFEPNLAPDSAPDKASGYVSGQVFVGKSKGLGYAFAIEPVGGGPQYLLKLGAGAQFDSSKNSEGLAAIKLPPGNYQVVTWIVYQTMFDEARFRAPFKNDALIGKPFRISAGSVVHLGNFSISVEERKYAPTPSLLWTLNVIPEMQETSEKKFRQSYPNLAPLPFRCMACLDTGFAPPK